MSDGSEPVPGETPEIGDYRLDEVSAPPRRPRWWVPVLAAGTVGAVTVGGVIVASRVSGSAGHPAPAAGARTSVPATPLVHASTPPASPYEALLVRDGTLVEGSGRVVKVPGKAPRFCAPVPVPAVAYVEGHEPAPAWCPVGVDVAGVDLTKLDQSRTKAGATEGQAYLRGTYRGGVLHVTLQTGQRSSPLDDTLSVNPSDCPARPGGWRRVPSGSNPSDGLQTLVEKYRTAHPGQIVSEAVARPDAHALYLVIAVEDVAMARKELPVRPGYLCVLQSRWTRAQIDAVTRPWESSAQAATGPVAVAPSDGVWGVGESVDTQGQASVGVQLVMVTPESVSTAESAPAGLLHLDPWLRPVSAAAPLPSPVPTAPPQSMSSAGLASFIAASASASSYLAASAAPGS